MDLKINKKKFKIFLEVAEALNRRFGLAPILYGSLGLYKIIGEYGKADDIDVLVPGEFINEKWASLIDLMQSLNFRLKDEYEHEFVGKGERMAFGNEADLSQRVQLDPRTLKISKAGGAEFKQLSPEQYLKVYRFMLRDRYRQDKRGGADRDKIVLIKKYISRFHGN